MLRLSLSLRLFGENVQHSAQIRHYTPRMKMRGRINTFKTAMHDNQAQRMALIDDEVSRVMQKMLLKEKVRGRKNMEMQRTNKAFFELSSNECAATLLNSQNVNMPTGSPESLAVMKDGMPKAFLTTRMKVFNTNFSRAIAEAFLMDEELNRKIEEYQVQITQVRVSSDYKLLNIYWTTTRDDIDLEEIAGWLSSNGGNLHRAMIDTQYTNNVPWLSFIYDLQENYEREIQKRLNLVKDDLVSESVKRMMNKNEDADKEEKPEVKEEEEKVFSDKSLNFESQIQEVNLDDYYYDVLHTEKQSSYTHLKYISPGDMQQDQANVEYEPLINKVLQNLKRTRQKMDLHSQFSPSFSGASGSSDPSSFQANQVGIHLPPIDVRKQFVVNTEIDYNTDERIKQIKKFVQLNKKKRNWAEARMKRKILEEECQKFANYEDLRDRVEERFNHHFKDVDGKDE